MPSPASTMNIRAPYPPPSLAAASRLAVAQEARELLYAEYCARERSHLELSLLAASRYGPPPPAVAEVAAVVVQAPPARAAPSVPRRSFAPTRRHQHGAAPVAAPSEVAGAAPPKSPKKSADELAAATVLAALMGGSVEEAASPSQVVEGRRPPSSLPPKKQHKTQTHRQATPSTKRQHQPRSQAQTAIYESHKSLSSAMADNMYCLPTATAPPPAPGHVSDENSIIDDNYSSDGCSRANSPMPSSGGAVGPEAMDGTAKWFKGSCSLSLPEDDDVLSPLHCFMRRYCVEAFSASPEDVATPRYGKSHGFKVEVGQVGIRCLYCKHQSVGKRPERAVCYPSSLRNIYHSIETWQRRHSLVCTHITPWVRKSIVELMESSKTRAGGRRQYWEDSAQRLGMVDTPRGVRFCRTPGDEGAPAPSPQGKVPTGPASDSTVVITNLDAKPVVREEDNDLVTDYLFLLMEQMQTCKFTEEDRTGGRSKVKDNDVGFPGMECRHCQGRAGFGRYFPSSVAALSLANSDRNVFNHLQKCRRCPSNIKSELVRLSKEQSQSKNRRGLRKLFFNRIWDRIHDGDATTTTPASPSEFAPASAATSTPSPTTVPMETGR